VRKLAFSFLLLLGISAAALERQPNADYHARREALSRKTNGGVVVLFAPTEPEGPNALYGFRQDDNFYYLTGWSEPGAAVLIAPAAPPAEGMPTRPYTEILFLPAHNLSQEKWTGPKLGPESPDVPKVTGFDQVEVLDKFRDELVRLLPQSAAAVFSDLPGHGENTPSSGGLAWLRRANAFGNYVSFQDIKPLLASLRVIKDAGEIDLIRKATGASVAAHLSAMRAMKPGITEREISALMQYEFGKRGCERSAYAPIVGSGYNSTVLHYSQDSATVKSGDLVVLDVGGEYSMYATDITRTLPANGKFSPRQREIYDIVWSAQQAAIAVFRAGVSTLGRTTPNSLHKLAYDYINTHGRDIHGQPLGKYFIHGLGHSVGLNVHDVGLNAALQPGMVFTLEPGIYLPEESLGVRIEDTFLVGSDGKLVNLSGALPSTAEAVERTMAGKQ